MNKILPTGKEDVVYSGKIFHVIKKEVQIGDEIDYFEVARRAPGVRTIICNGDKVLLIKEYRHELEKEDFRLPGGKVFDHAKDYQKALDTNVNILEIAATVAKLECKQEAGIEVTSIKHIGTSTMGSTVEWDLHYFFTEEFSQAQQELEQGEIIEPEWFTKEEVKNMCFSGAISEERTIMKLLQFLD